MNGSVGVAKARADVWAGRRGQRPVLHECQTDLDRLTGPGADLDQVVEDGELTALLDGVAGGGQTREHARGPGFRQGRSHEVGVGPVNTDTNFSRSCTVMSLPPSSLNDSRCRPSTRTR